jgi:hypothetical protein
VTVGLVSRYISELFGVKALIMLVLLGIRVACPCSLPREYDTIGVLCMCVICLFQGVVGCNDCRWFRLPRMQV